VDPRIVEQFEEWLAEAGGEEPWCTTVSFVNPHDIAWWYKWSDRRPGRGAGAGRDRAPAAQLRDAGAAARAPIKPRLQRSFQDIAAASFGPVPFTGPEQRSHLAEIPPTSTPSSSTRWTARSGPRHAHPGKPSRGGGKYGDRVSPPTTGEYGASHGLRGKGASAYEEGIPRALDRQGSARRAPPRAPGRNREQLTSSVDVAPLLLSIASGSNDWRREPHYAHLADRLDLTSILADPAAPGRPYVLHATDETVTEYRSSPTRPTRRCT